MKKLVLVTLLGAAILTACKTSKKQTEIKKTEPAKVEAALDCSGTDFSYEKDIKPIMEQYCNSCHGYNGADGLNLMDRNDVEKIAKNGELLGTIKWKRGYPKMPAGATQQLDKATIDKIECWISNGMK